MALLKTRFASLVLAILTCLEAQAAGAPPKANDAPTLLKRANFYRSALSKEQDPALAFHWMREAALKGLPAAQFELAKMLLGARGAPFDLAQAREWLQKASAKDKRATALLTRISQRPPQPPPAIPKHTMSAPQFALSPAATSRNGAAGINDAAARGDAPALEALLRAGASIETKSDDGSTPLMAAALEGRIQLVRLLLGQGADPNARNIRGETALILAIRSRKADVAALLVSGGKIAQESLNAAVFTSAETCDASTLQRLLENNARPTPRKDGETALMRAAAGCPAPMIEILTKLDPLDAVDKSGRTALWIAAQHGNIGVVAALLAKGVSRDMADPFGITPLLAALEHGQEDVALLLIHAGANVSAASDSGQTPLIVSAHRGLKAAALEALNHGADPNARDALGVSALMAAAQHGHAEIVGAMLARGADRNLRNKKRETAVELAADEKTRSLLLN